MGYDPRAHHSNGALRHAAGAEWENLVASASETRQRFRAWYGALEEQVKERPGPAVAAAVGAGFALGGGLLTPFAFRLVRVSLSVAARVTAAAWALRALSRLAERQGAARPVDVSSPS
jgi:hypothetical protein